MKRIRLGAPARCRAAVVAVLLLASGAAGQDGFDFAPPVILDIGFDAYPNSVDAGYIDGDSWIDLILAGRNNDGLAVIFYGTPGGFGPAVQLDMGGQTNWAVVRAFNSNSSFNDLVLSHRSGLGRISVLGGNGTQVPGDPVVYAAGREPQLLGAADFDGDQDLDLAVFNADSFDISILANDGNGVFTPVQRIAVNRTASSSASPTWAQIVDVDGDGYPDIVAMNLQSHGAVSILHNRGDGTFDTAVQHAVAGIETGEAMSTLTAVDLDGDNDVDLVTKVGSLSFQDRIVVLTNDGTGSFDTAIHIQLQSSPWDITTGDFDNDGHPDIVWITHAFSSQAVGFLRNLGSSTPDFATPEPEVVLGGFPRTVIAFDIDGDTDLDVIVANIGSHSVAVLENLHVQTLSGRPTPTRRPASVRAIRPQAAPATLAEAMTRLAAWGAPSTGANMTVEETSMASGGACGDPEAGDCFEPHEGPGCHDEACCSLVCEEFALCCQLNWDQPCADIANDVCEPPPVCPGEGSCFEPHDSPGCLDAVCCELVCGFDPFCCDAPWDQLCADQANQVCGLPACALAPCSAQTIHEPETIDCDGRVNDGCNLLDAAFTPISCNETICGTAYTFYYRSTDWYEIIVDEPAELAWSVRAEFPAEIFIVSGTCDDTYTIVASAFTNPCGLGAARLSVEPGTYYLYVAPGFESIAMDQGIGCRNEGELLRGGPFGHRYYATATCGSGCAEDLSGDARVGIEDLLILLSVWGTDPGGPPDFDGDGTVTINDFTILLAAWGAC